MNDEHNPYQTPIAQPASPASTMGGVYSPTWKQILFSFQGRIRRAHYWAAVGVQILIMLVGFGPIAVLGESEAASTVLLLFFGIVALVAAVLYIWIALATQVKRWHDRNKSGAWVLIGFIPYIGGFWVFIECGCLGAVEPNRYGPAAA